jgi:hypothetical protein
MLSLETLVERGNEFFSKLLIKAQFRTDIYFFLFLVLEKLVRFPILLYLLNLG